MTIQKCFTSYDLLNDADSSFDHTVSNGKMISNWKNVFVTTCQAVSRYVRCGIDEEHKNISQDNHVPAELDIRTIKGGNFVPTS
jgi:hypothetical protein